MNLNIEKKIKKLREEIEKYNYEYYILNESTISDLEYDLKINELKKLEQDYPQFYNENSPSLKVGGTISKKFKKVKHSTPMLSLSNTFNIEGLKKFYFKLSERFNNIEFVCELKIDGLSISLIYENNKLKIASTRGDGLIGEDVTNNVLTIKDIPKNISLDERFEIRGEIFLKKTQLKKINEERIQKGIAPLANSRNAASGSLRQLDSSITSKRSLNSFFYSTDTKGYNTLDVNKHFLALEKIKNLGFSTEKHSKLCRSFEEITDYIDFWEKKRESLDYDIDGIVIKLNNIDLYNTLGYTSKDPRWAIAYKFMPKLAETCVKDIILTVGRTGKITPNAILYPVKLSGSIITKATIHNIDVLLSSDIRINDNVFIKKAGEIIPQIVEVNLNKRKENSKPYIFDYKCPSCNHKLIRVKDNVDYFCVNKNCKEKEINKILHFVSRDAMNIEGFGKSTIIKLYDKLILRNISDIFKLKYEDFINIENFGDKSINNILKSIEKSKKTKADSVLYGLGIPHVGKRISKLLLDNYLSIKTIMNLTVEEMTSMKDIGFKIAESINLFFKDSTNIFIINSLEEEGLQLSYDKKEKVDITNKKLYKECIVITGKFPNYKREQLKEILLNNGASLSDQVNKKTTFLLKGIGGGKKYNDAINMGIPIYNIEEFEKKFLIKV